MLRRLGTVLSMSNTEWKSIKKKLVQILCIAEWNWLTHSTNCLNKDTFYFACITKTSQKTLWKKIKSEVFKFVLSNVQFDMICA